MKFSFWEAYALPATGAAILIAALLAAFFYGQHTAIVEINATDKVAIESKAIYLNPGYPSKLRYNLRNLRTGRKIRIHTEVNKPLGYVTGDTLTILTRKPQTNARR